jgi:hypothetical protein
MPNMGPQGMQPPPFGGGMPPQYGGPSPQQPLQHGGYPIGGFGGPGGPGGGGFGGPGGHGGPGGGGFAGPGGGGFGGPNVPGGGGGNWDRKPRVCSFFNSPQGCRNGDACQFQHVVGVSGKWPHERQERRR